MGIAPRISAVIFDIGRVVVAVDSHAGLYLRLRRHHPGALSRWFDREERMAVLRDFGTGKATGRDVHAALCADLDLDLGYDEFVRLWCAVLQPLPHGETIFRAVADRVPVGICSNTNALHWRDLRVRFPWLRIPRCPTLSFEVGLAKPDPAIFRLAADDVGFPPEECLFFDDLLPNVEAARGVGMHASQFTSAETLVAVLQKHGVVGDVPLPLG